MPTGHVAVPEVPSVHPEPLLTGDVASVEVPSVLPVHHCPTLPGDVAAADPSLTGELASVDVLPVPLDPEDIAAAADPLMTGVAASVAVPSVLPVQHDSALAGDVAGGGGRAACHGVQWHALGAQDKHEQEQGHALEDEEAEEEGLA